MQPRHLGWLEGEAETPVPAEASKESRWMAVDREKCLIGEWAAVYTDNF